MNAAFLRHALLVSLAALSFAAPAQDLGSVLRGVLGGRSKGLDDVLGAIRSISDVSFGQAGAGNSGPPDAQGKVVLYRTSWCGYCKQAAAHMRERNIAFMERDIEANPTARTEYRGLGGKGGVPLILMGDKTMAGFKAADFDQAYARFQPPTAALPGADTSAAPPATVAVSPAPPNGVLRPRIGNVKLYESPSASSRIVATLQKTDEVVASGEVQNGFMKVDGASVTGAWVRISLMGP